jgi:inner membrane protein
MEPVTLIDRLNTWIRESVTVKLISIGILVILLLIPTAWILQIMEERQQRAGDVMEEVYGKWSGSQTVAGPVWIVPYRKMEKSLSTSGQSQSREVIDHAFFLPSTLKITGLLKPQVLHRGIFDIAVYESELELEAAFDAPDLAALGIAPDDMMWNDARLVAGISDLRGIAEPPVLVAGQTPLVVEPSNDIGFSFPGGDKHSSANRAAGTTGVQAPWKGSTAKDFKGVIRLQLSLKGSNSLRFLPLGKTTDLTLGGAWSDPGFEGEFLPVTRRISKEDFEASWKVLHFNRPFVQQWVSRDKTLEAYDMSTRLVIPADQYQKSIRTAKYGILLILLSFTALFLVEISRKIRIHPFQYILVGVALIVYYTLLLSLSEYAGYNTAYLAATIATVILVSLYAKSFLKNTQLSVLFAGLLSLFYGFVFVVIQAQDFSLLLGSIGLFAVVAAIMYFSRSINWYGEDTNH